MTNGQNCQGRHIPFGGNDDLFRQSPQKFARKTRPNCLSNSIKPRSRHTCEAVLLQSYAARHLVAWDRAIYHPLLNPTNPESCESRVFTTLVTPRFG
eukprot:8064577-Pyramimonas_sp.AAC.1